MKDMSEVKKTIDELKELVLVMHRNAGHLDRIIQDLEIEYNKCMDDDEYLNLLAIHMPVGRIDYKNSLVGNIDERETELWNKLIKLTKVEEESQ